MVRRRDIAVAKGDSSHFPIGQLYVLAALIDGSSIGPQIVLYGEDLLANFPKGLEEDLPIVFQIFVGGGEINRDHCVTGRKNTSCEWLFP